MSKIVNGASLQPLSGAPPKHLILLRHANGSSGADLIAIAPHSRKSLPDKLFLAGISIVDGADGSGHELVRELELYRQAGLSNAEAMQTATINSARLTGMDGQSGSVAPGMTANLVPVDDDVSKDLGNLRRVETVFLEEYASIVSRYDLRAV